MDVNGPGGGSFADLHARALDRLTRDRPPSVDLAESGAVQAVGQRDLSSNAAPTDVGAIEPRPPHDVPVQGHVQRGNEVASPGDARAIAPPGPGILDLAVPGNVQPPGSHGDDDLSPQAATQFAAGDTAPLSPSTRRHPRTPGRVAAPDPAPRPNASPDTGGVAAPPAGAPTSRRARTAS